MTAAPVARTVSAWVFAIGVVAAAVVLARTGSGVFLGVDELVAKPTGALGSLGGVLPFGYAFAAGMLAAVNPCGFALLPGYLALYLGETEPTASPAGRLARALGVAGTVSAAFVLTFGVAGLLLATVGAALGSALPFVGLAVGLGLVAAGGYVLSGGKVYSSIGDPGGGTARWPRQCSRLPRIRRVRDRICRRLTGLRAANLPHGGGPGHGHPRPEPERRPVRPVRPRHGARSHRPDGRHRAVQGRHAGRCPRRRGEAAGGCLRRAVGADRSLCRRVLACARLLMGHPGGQLVHLANLEVAALSEDARGAARDVLCTQVALLAHEGEGPTIEYKSVLRTETTHKEKFAPLSPSPLDPPRRS
jgi:hypothetical protein